MSIFAVACVILFGASETLSAQAATARHWPQRGWVSLGLGIGTQNSAALTAAAVYSPGPLAIVGRKDWTGQIFAEQIEDNAVLVGLRTPKPSRFAIGALGVARVRSYRTCDGCGVTRVDPTVTALAFEAKAFAGVSNASYGLSVYGVAGPRRVRYVAAGLSIQFGWFGE